MHSEALTQKPSPHVGTDINNSLNTFWMLLSPDSEIWERYNLYGKRGGEIPSVIANYHHLADGDGLLCILRSCLLLDGRIMPRQEQLLFDIFEVLHPRRRVFGILAPSNNRFDWHIELCSIHLEVKHVVKRT
jgi:hypothetical protein